MYNNKTCDTCDHFDPVLKGKHGKVVETVWGWCAAQSIYPTNEGPGQKFPAGVTRAAEGEMAKPKIVRKNEVIPSCKLFKARRNKPSKADLLEKLK